MAQGTPPNAGIGLPIPQEGLAEVLGAWSGQGELWEALGCIQPETDSERVWSSNDVERRAHRILFARVVPLLMAWPESRNVWLEALPALSSHVQAVTPYPTAGTKWVDTRRRFGWPPTAFESRHRERVADSLMLTSFRWTLEFLEAIRSDALALEPTLDGPVKSRLDSVLKLLNIDPLFSAPPITPARHDIDALRAEGFPWTRLASVADVLRMVNDGSMMELSRSLVFPDEDLRWRLFHLGVFGTLLGALRKSGANLMSLRPLSGASTGPAYRVTDSLNRRWELWFEAGGMWSYHRKSSPYLEATAGLKNRDRRPISPDVCLVLPGVAALAIECKYSANASTVGRQGYQQAMAYAVELKTAFAPRVWSVVVGPESVVGQPSLAETEVGSVGLAPPSALAALIDTILATSHFS